MFEHVEVDLALGEDLRQEHLELRDVLREKVGRGGFRVVGGQWFYMRTLYRDWAVAVGTSRYLNRSRISF